MYRRYVLWGSAGHAKVLADIVALNGGQVVALFDNNPEAVSCLAGVPLYRGACGFKEWLNEQESLEGIGAVLAIAGTRGEERQQLAQQLQATGLSLPSLIRRGIEIGPAGRRLSDPCQWRSWRRTFQWAVSASLIIPQMWTMSADLAAVLILPRGRCYAAA